MVDVSAEVYEFESALGGIIRSSGPIGRGIGQAHSDRFEAELRRLTALEPDIKLSERNYGMPALYLPGTAHAYWTYSGLAQDPDVDTDLWTAHVVLTYAAEDAHYDVLSEKGKVGVYRNPEFCAAIVLAAVKAHQAMNFSELPVTEQYTARDLRMFASIRG